MVRRVWSIAFDATNHFLAEDGWAIASHIALSALMSLFPFLIFVTAIAGFLGSKDLADEVARLIFSAWPAAVAGPIAAEVRDVLTAPRGGLLTVGAALALYFSSNAIEALRVGLDRAYACPETRPWWLLRLQSLAFMIVGAAALLGLALLVVLGPLIWATAVGFVPALAPMQGDGDLRPARRRDAAARGDDVHRPSLAAGGAAALRRHRAGRRRELRQQHRLWRSLRRSILSQFARNYVSTYAGLASVMIALVVPLFAGRDFRLRRRAQRGDHAGARRAPPRPGRADERTVSEAKQAAAHQRA